MRKTKAAKKRAVAKTFTWRITATATTIIIAWLVTGDIRTGFAIGAIEFIAKMFIFYIHERTWEKSDFGYESS